MGKPLPLVPPISIHALREEGDLTTDTELRQTVISIHALREEGDNVPREWIERVVVFLSTPSARRATELTYTTLGGFFRFLSTPSARRATTVLIPNTYSKTFLSTPSARRATHCITPTII